MLRSLRVFKEQGVFSLWRYIWLVGDEGFRSQHRQPSTSYWSVVSVLVNSIQVTSPTWWGFQHLQNSSKVMAQNIRYGPCGHCSVTKLRDSLFVTPWAAARQASLSITNSRSLPKLMSIESVMPSNHLILCHPLLLLPPVPASIRVFSNESFLCIRWPRYWSFSISPHSEYSGLMSFGIDWVDLPAVQETLKSLFQHHGSEVSILWYWVFFMMPLSCLYMMTRKTRTLTIPLEEDLKVFDFV